MQKRPPIRPPIIKRLGWEDDTKDANGGGDQRDGGGGDEADGGGGKTGEKAGGADVDADTFKTGGSKSRKYTFLLVPIRGEHGTSKKTDVESGGEKAEDEKDVAGNGGATDLYRHKSYH